MRNLLLVLTGFLSFLSGQAAYGQSGETSEYVFITEQSTVTQTGGIAGVHRTYSIEGRFRLQVNPEAGVASFLRIDANAVDDSDDRYTLDPNEVFNLTGLTGAIVDETSIRFDGKTDDGSSVLITLTFADDTVTLCGGTAPPPNSADFFIFALDVATQRKYAGGTGEADDPYRIATAADLITLGETPEDYDKHFILTADIDLDPNLPDCKVFERAVIAADANTGVTSRFEGTPFRGTFDGHARTISHLTVEGGFYSGLFGCVAGPNAAIRNVRLIDPNVDGYLYGGALAGRLDGGGIMGCSVTGGTIASDGTVGGLVSYHHAGSIIDCSVTDTHIASNGAAGGLAGSQYSGNISGGLVKSSSISGRVVAGGLGACLTN